jgi:hypothetical protein
MGNATPALKAQADVIAPAVDDDGLAWVLDTLGDTPTRGRLETNGPNAGR